MKSFEELYKEFNSNIEINEVANKVQEERKKRNKLAAVLCISIDMILVFFIYNTIKFSIFKIMFYIGPIFITDMIILLILFLALNSKYKEYVPLFKENVIKSMLNNFFTEIEFFPDKMMPSQIYKEGKYEGYDIYHSDDYIEGKIENEYLIDMAEVHTEREETYKDSDGNTNTRTYTIFHGMFAKIIMEKSINSNLRITLNHAGYKDRLEMDSSEFEKYFDVFASDKIIGMQILTADVMEEIVELKNKIKQHFDIFIDNNALYLRFHCGAMFEPKMRKKQNLDENSLKMYYNILKFINELSNKIIKTIKEVQI